MFPRKQFWSHNEICSNSLFESCKSLFNWQHWQIYANISWPLIEMHKLQMVFTSHLFLKLVQNSQCWETTLFSYGKRKIAGSENSILLFSKIKRNIWRRIFFVNFVNFIGLPVFTDIDGSSDSRAEIVTWGLTSWTKLYFSLGPKEKGKQMSLLQQPCFITKRTQGV